MFRAISASIREDKTGIVMQGSKMSVCIAAPRGKKGHKTGIFQHDEQQK